MRERELLDLGAMVLVISETLKDLRTPEIRKGPSNLFHIAPKKKIGHDIVNSDACPFDSRISPAYARCFDNVTIPGRRFHDSDYITGRCKIDIVLLHFEPAEHADGHQSEFRTQPPDRGSLSRRGLLILTEAQTLSG